MTNTDSYASDQETVRRLNRRDFFAGAAGLGLAASGLHRLANTPFRLTTIANASRQPVTISFWTQPGDAIVDPIMAKQTAEYNTTVGRAAGVKAIFNTVSTADNYLKYTEAMSTSASPDLVLTFSYNPVVQWAASGLLLPLRPTGCQVRFPREGLLSLRMEHAELRWARLGPGPVGR